MTESEPTTSAEIKKVWLRREKAALAPLGFKHLRRDLYVIKLGEDWEGQVGLHKRAATGPALMCYFDPPSATLNHLPTQQLMRDLYGRGPKDPGFVILAADRFDIPSNETLRSISRLRPTNLKEIDEAISRSVQMIEDEILPWMRSQVDIGTLTTSLSIPSASPGIESGRLEKLAVVNYLRGDKAGALAALNTLRQEHMPSGVPAIDEPQEKFWQALNDRLREI